VREETNPPRIACCATELADDARRAVARERETAVDGAAAPPGAAVNVAALSPVFVWSEVGLTSVGSNGFGTAPSGKT
jgi:hypothetical protein